VTAPRELLQDLLASRLSRLELAWLDGACHQAFEARRGPPAEFATLISLASRHVPREALAPTAAERARAFDVLEGFNPERWSLLDAARAVIVLSRSDLHHGVGVEAIEECFRYADVGELVALYRTLPLIEDGKRFTWRMGEGCRSSMRAVYESAACDTPFALLWFDAPSFRQLAIKALFIEAPLWRVYGLDQRVDAELARIALDLADERRSAARPVQHELWLCLGRVAGDRGRAALELELAGTNQTGRRAAAIALARAGAMERLGVLCAAEKDPLVRETMKSALAGRSKQTAFQDLDPANTTN